LAFHLQTDRITERSIGKIKTKLRLYSGNVSLKEKLEDIIEGLNELPNKATQAPSKYLLENCNDPIFMKETKEKLQRYSYKMNNNKKNW
jgi:hypothetical protein